MAKTPPLPREVMEAFERRQPIEAIKLLLRAKAGGAPVAPQSHPMQQMQARAPAPPPASMAPHSATAPKPIAWRRGDPSPGELPRVRSTLVDWVVVALLLYLAYRFVAALA